MIFQISPLCEDRSLVQRSAAETLLRLLGYCDRADVPDLGGGVGNMTGGIREMTRGRVVGVDPSEGMIREASKNDFFTKNRVKTALRVGSRFLIKLL